MSIILSKEECMTAYNEAEKCWVIGNDFAEEDGFDESTIRWSEDGWKDELDYFHSYLMEQVALFEKQLHTRVEKIALLASDSSGNTELSFLSASGNPLETYNESKKVEVEIQRDEVVRIHIGDRYHHQEVTLHFLTPKRLRLLAAVKVEEQAEYIQSYFRPLKLTRRGKDYFNPQI